jgi:hypothetical protein
VDTVIVTMLAIAWAAVLLLIGGVFYGVIHAGKRYPLLGLILAAFLTAGLARPLPGRVDQ